MNAVSTGKLNQINPLPKIVFYVTAIECTVQLFIKDLRKNPDRKLEDHFRLGKWYDKQIDVITI
jgi:hypothetical protein